MDYEKDIKIDESALDVEWLEQAQLMLKYCQHAAQCRAEMDRAKEAMDALKAELDKEIRTDPESFGVAKITETVVQNTIIADSEYKKSVSEYIDIKYEFDMAQAAVRAIDQKKTALENLVKLHGMSYFAGPKVPRDISKEWEQKQKNTNRKVKIKKER